MHQVILMYKQVWDCWSSKFVLKFFTIYIWANFAFEANTPRILLKLDLSAV